MLKINSLKYNMSDIQYHIGTYIQLYGDNLTILHTSTASMTELQLQITPIILF